MCIRMPSGARSKVLQSKGHHSGLAPPSATPTSQGTTCINHNSRFRTCELLAQEGIINVIWFEDLLDSYDSDDESQDLTLLVHDPPLAADILTAAGYRETLYIETFQDELELSQRPVRMQKPKSETGVVLRSAKDWCYNLDESVQNFRPPIHKYLDSIMEFWLNISSRDYVDKINFVLYIGGLIAACYKHTDADGTPLNDPAFAKNLEVHHRELHYDITAKYPPKKGFTITDRHQYHARMSREIKAGFFTPKPYEKGSYRPPLSTLSE